MPESVKSTPGGGAAQLVLTAERLFAQHGIDEVSMRQIVVAAGQANSYAIQHHFGGKSGLIRAILDLRLPELDARTGARLKKLKKAGQLDARSLLDALIMPVEEFVDSAGKHVFAQFLLRDGLAAYMAAGDRKTYPAAIEVADLLANQLELDPKTFEDRLYLVTLMYLNAILILDRRDVTAAARKTYLHQAIDMGLAALRA